MVEPHAVRPVSNHAPFFIVFNPGSGHQDAGQVREIIERTLRDAEREFQINVLSDPRKLRAAAQDYAQEAQRQDGVLVAVGGDGTLNTVAHAALRVGCRFGVLPQGTFNYFSRTHGIPSEIDAALAVLLHSSAQPVQVGMVNEHVFLVNASLGLYPQVLEDREAWKQRLGRWRIVAMLAALATVLRGHRQLQLRLQYQGETRDIRTPTLVVINNRLQLQQMGIEEAALLDHRLLLALVLKPVNTLTILGLVLRGALGKLGEAEEVVEFAFEHLTIDSPPGTRHKNQLKVAMDGEIHWLPMPLQLRVAPEPLYLLKPLSIETGATDTGKE